MRRDEPEPANCPGIPAACLGSRPSTLNPQPSRCSRREFLGASALLALTAFVPGCRTSEGGWGPEPIIDIHQHRGYSGRSDEVLLAHQRTMGVTKTILLAAGRPANTASTHNGFSNGLQAQCLGNQYCYRFAKAHPKHYLFAACEVPDLPDAAQEIEKYLKLGGLGFLLGDGRLNYAREDILEGYYNLHTWRGIYYALDAQYINHPGYNQDRGPVLVESVRMHVDF